jgi:uncharacterized protein involved in cysteine biosynthesis
VFAAFARAVAQLADARIGRIVLFSVLLSAVLFISLWAGIAYLLTHTAVFASGWLEAAVDVLGGLATIGITWFLFPAVVSATIGLFLDRVAAIVEDTHYPGLPPPRALGIEEMLVTTVRFLAMMLALNLLVLVFLLVPPLFPFVFYAANGYLLGREYFELVALRRIDPNTALSLKRAHRKTLFGAGVVIAVLLTLPLVNLLAPIIGTAAMVHVFESLRRRMRADPAGQG